MQAPNQRTCPPTAPTSAHQWHHEGIPALQNGQAKETSSFALLFAGGGLALFRFPMGGVRASTLLPSKVVRDDQKFGSEYKHTVTMSYANRTRKGGDELRSQLISVPEPAWIGDRYAAVANRSKLKGAHPSHTFIAITSIFFDIHCSA